MGKVQVPAWLAEHSEVIPLGSRPQREGLGRMTRLRAAMEILPLPDRKLLLQSLDEISRPMNAREIDQALLATRLSRGDRKRLTLALKNFSIMLLVRP